MLRCTVSHTFCLFNIKIHLASLQFDLYSVTQSNLSLGLKQVLENITQPLTTYFRYIHSSKYLKLTRKNYSVVLLISPRRLTPSGELGYGKNYYSIMLTEKYLTLLPICIRISNPVFHRWVMIRRFWKFFRGQTRRKPISSTLCSLLK